MHSPLAIAAIIFGCTITPGPNNFAILQLAATQDRHAAFRGIAAIVSGGLALYALVRCGLELWIGRHPWAGRILLVCSGAYLVWLGGTFIYRSFRSAGARVATTVPASALALLVFQLVNPKGWLLMTSVSAAAYCTPRCTSAAEALPVLLLTVIPAVSLLSWLLLGSGVRRLFAVEMNNSYLLRIGGAALMVSALSLFGV